VLIDDSSMVTDSESEICINLAFCCSFGIGLNLNLMQRDASASNNLLT
jgi:hypothetical protein